MIMWNKRFDTDANISLSVLRSWGGVGTAAAAADGVF